jgi:hypothetical protein
LRDYFLKQVPHDFVGLLMQRQEPVYMEAQASAFNDPRWTRSEGRSLVGDFERAIFENVTRKCAKLAGLKYADIEHRGKNSSCVQIAASNLRLTTHRVPMPGYFVRPCESRKEAAAVNKFMDGYHLDGALCAPLPTLESAECISLYILHGKYIKSTGEQRLFMQIAAPDASLDEYRWICDFGELHQAYMDDRRRSDDGEMKDERKPKLKIIKKIEEK